MKEEYDWEPKASSPGDTEHLTDRDDHEELAEEDLTSPVHAASTRGKLRLNR